MKIRVTVYRDPKLGFMNAWTDAADVGWVRDMVEEMTPFEKKQADSFLHIVERAAIDHATKIAATEPQTVFPMPLLVEIKASVVTDSEGT